MTRSTLVRGLHLLASMGQAIVRQRGSGGQFIVRGEESDRPRSFSRDKLILPQIDTQKNGRLNHLFRVLWLPLTAKFFTFCIRPKSGAIIIRIRKRPGGISTTFAKRPIFGFGHPPK